MFWTGLILGLILGANISLFLYAIILAGKESDEKWYYQVYYLVVVL